MLRRSLSVCMSVRVCSPSMRRRVRLPLRESKPLKRALALAKKEFCLRRMTVMLRMPTPSEPERDVLRLSSLRSVYSSVGK